VIFEGSLRPYLTSSEKRLRLMELIKQIAIKNKEVKLSSKEKSNYYYDIKALVHDAEGVTLIGELMLQKLKEIQPDAKSVGGLEVGAVPIETAIVYHSYQLREEHQVTGFFVRKTPKTHGLEKLIEGCLREPAVVVDDVITTGQSVLDAVNALNSEGISPVNILSVIDRQSDSNLLVKNNIKFHSLFKHSEFAEYIESNQSTVNQ
jgi:orotate phosphoribosyltransferase